MPSAIRVRRVYDAPSPDDGARVLVDRIWPRGLRKDAARLDEWAKDVAPSTGLRTWYGHDPAKFGEFRRRYLGELSGGAERTALEHLRATCIPANAPTSRQAASGALRPSTASTASASLSDLIRPVTPR